MQRTAHYFSGCCDDNALMFIFYRGHSMSQAGVSGPSQTRTIEALQAQLQQPRLLSRLIAHLYIDSKRGEASSIV